VDLIAAILTVLFISIVLNTLLKRLGVPTVIGYIFTGVMVSLLFGLHHNQDDSLNHIAEFGIVFLMFTIGLEFSFKNLLAMRKQVLTYGSLQLLLTASLIGMGAFVLGVDLKGAIIIGLSLALSSTAIVLKTLNEKQQIHTPYGKSSVGILLFQDMAVIPILLMITIFASKEADLSQMLMMTVVDALIVGVIIYVIGKYLLTPLLEWITQTDSSEIFLATVLFLVIGSAQLAHVFGFSYSLGAFLAGMILAETRFKYQIESKLISFRDLLMGLFFITVGMQINLPIIVAYMGTIISLSMLIMIVKFIVILSMLYFLMRLRTGIKTALALSQIGEFSLAIISLSLSDKLLSVEEAQILFGATVLSMIVSVLILANIRRIADWLYPEPEVIPLVKTAQLSHHVIVCGYGPMGRNVIHLLKQRGVPYVILEHDIQAVNLGESRGEPIYFANAANPDILQHFNVKEASAVIVAIGNDRHLRLICEAFNRVSDQVNLVIKASNCVELKMLEDLEVDHIVLQSEEMAKLLVDESMRCSLDLSNKAETICGKS